MAYPIKTLKDEHNELFIPYTTSTSIVTSSGSVLQNVLDVKLDPADVKAGSNIQVTPGTDNVTVAWVRPTNLTVKNQLDVASAGQGVLDAAQGKILNDKFANYILKDTMGKANGVATLGSDGKVPSGQLPAYVDDVIEAYIVSGSTALSSGWLSTTSTGTAFTPQTGKIYVIMSSGSYQNKQYRWGGSTYVLCNPSDVNSVNGMTGVVTLKTLTLKTAEGRANIVNETFNAGADKTVTINVPAKTSQITNDSGFITAASDISGNAATATVADKTQGTLTIKMKNYDNNTETTDTFNGNVDKTITIGVPTKVSQLDNDSQFITASASITGNAATATTAATATKTQGTLTIKMKNYDTNTETTDSFNGNADKTITIGVPTKLSQLNNDTGFITSVPQASATVSGTVKIGTGLAINSNGVVYVTGEGVTADEVDWDKINGKPTHLEAFSNENTQYITASDSITGNAKTATTLQTARTINGTSFNGSANITTANWGTARNISIADSDATNTGTAVSVNGSANATLKLPATIKATLSGNASSATKVNNNLVIKLNGGTTEGTNLFTFNGSAAKSLNITPSSIGAAASSHTHNYAGSDSAGGAATTALTCSGNAATATTLATARTLTIGATGKTFNGSANVSWTLAEIGAAASSHTHSYAGSSSAGGAANSVKTNLIIKLNGGSTEGTNLFTFNGSAAKTINITPSAIGASASSHTHSYLPLSGGTLTGLVTSSYTSTTWINSADGKSAINLSGTGYTGWIAGNAKNGRLVISSYPGSDDKLYFGYMTNDAITAGTNALTRQMSWDGSTGTLTATTFAGKMSNTLTLTKNGSNSTYNGSAATTVTIPTIHTGTGAPAASLGQDGDIYIVTG